MISETFILVLLCQDDKVGKLHLVLHVAYLLADVVSLSGMNLLDHGSDGQVVHQALEMMGHDCNENICCLEMNA